MPRARILCVDDDPPQLMIMAAILRKEGYSVEVAHHGYQALKLAREWQPDLIVLDVMMPGIDGYQVTEKLKQSPETAHIAVLMLTAKADTRTRLHEPHEFAGRVQDQLKGFDSGAVEFLNKPIRAKDLVHHVKAILWARGLEA